MNRKETTMRDTPAPVEVREHLDGSASVHYQGACIARQPSSSGADLSTKPRGNVGDKPPPLIKVAPKPLPAAAHATCQPSLETLLVSA